MASGTAAHVMHLVEHGVVKPLVELYKSDDNAVKDQTSWALGNLAGDSAQVRDYIIDAGAVEPLYKFLLSVEAGSSMCKTASWALGNMIRKKPAVDYEKVKCAIPAMAKVLIENDSVEVLTDMCWGFSYLSEGAGGRIQ